MLGVGMCKGLGGVRGWDVKGVGRCKGLGGVGR